MSGTIKVAWDTVYHGGSPGPGRVWVQAYFGEFSTVPVEAGVSGDTVSFSNATVYGALRNEVWVGGGVVWAVGVEARAVGDIEWVHAGYTGNTIYMTLAAPAVSPLYHTVVHISTSASAGATTADEVLDKTWKAFQTLDVKSAPAAMGPMAARVTKKLHYYKSWDLRPPHESPRINMERLLEFGDGRCVAWVKLFEDTLNAQQAGTGGRMFTVVPKDFGRDRDLFLLVKNWEFAPPGTNDVRNWPYFNQTQNGEVFTKVGDTWDHVSGEATYKGGKGQGGTRPMAFFTNHALQLIGGKLYDPSYGTGPFEAKAGKDALFAWEEASIAGFAQGGVSTRNGVKLVGFASRKNVDGVLETKEG